jgi:3-mercaptopyruvate sulfurtransferase SseA
MPLVISTSSGYEVEGATTIDVEAAKTMHDRGVPFIDVHSTWMADHIPNAYSMEYDTGEFNETRLSQIVSKNQEVVIYAEGGLGGVGFREPANASAMAVIWGFEKVHFFADGIEAWRKAGYPVEEP